MSLKTFIKFKKKSDKIDGRSEFHQRFWTYLKKSHLKIVLLLYD